MAPASTKRLARGDCVEQRGSVAVIHTWPRSSSRGNRAARRCGSRWAATRRAAGSAARRGARRRGRHGQGPARAAALSARRSSAGAGWRLAGGVTARSCRGDPRWLGRRPRRAAVGEATPAGRLPQPSGRSRAAKASSGCLANVAQAVDRARPRFAENHAMLGHPGFEASARPDRRFQLGEQLVARAWRFVARCVMRMAGLERKHQPVENRRRAPALAVNSRSIAGVSHRQRAIRRRC